MEDRTAVPDLTQLPALPSLRDGVAVAGPGEYAFSGELMVEGAVTLRNLTLYLVGPIQVRTGARLTLDNVRLVIADPPHTPNGTSGLRCDGPAHLIMHDSSITPVGTAHPMWWWQGSIDMRRVRTHNAELHLHHVTGVIEDTNYFELELSHHSTVQARRVSAVFLSTHSTHTESLSFANIPTQQNVSASLRLASGSSVEWDTSRLEMLLLFLYGSTHARLERVARAQIAFILRKGTGRYRLPRGLLGAPDVPVLIPADRDATTGPRVELMDTLVDSWDAYISGDTRTHYTFVDSVIDEMSVGGSATVEVEQSQHYADWLDVRDEATLRVRDSTVGALSLAHERPDLLTSQIKVSGRARASFERVRFDCGILARDTSQVVLTETQTPPRYMTALDDASISSL